MTAVDPTNQVRALYEAYQERDWARAASCLHPDAVLAMPATRERLAGRDAVIGFQQNYPEPWGDLTVLRVVGGPAESAAEVQIIGPDGQRFAMACFWRQSDGLLADGVEYWVTVGAETPPPGRQTAFAEDDLA
jgi:ketosteroid isomerase-like protein